MALLQQQQQLAAAQQGTPGGRCRSWMMLTRMAHASAGFPAQVRPYRSSTMYFQNGMPFPAVPTAPVPAAPTLARPIVPLAQQPPMLAFQPPPQSFLPAAPRHQPVGRPPHDSSSAMPAPTVKAESGPVKPRPFSELLREKRQREEGLEQEASVSPAPAAEVASSHTAAPPPAPSTTAAALAPSAPPEPPAKKAKTEAAPPPSKPSAPTPTKISEKVMLRWLSDTLCGQLSLWLITL